MRLAAISVVRDEADIIEAFARHNLSFVDRLYIADDGSTDATAEILRRLTEEGLPVELFDMAGDASYFQSRKTMELLRHAMAQEDWTYIFPLDGDEFLAVESRQVLEEDLSTLGPREVGGLNPRHHVMSAEDDPSDPDPLSRQRHIARHAPHVFKVVVSTELARDPGSRLRDGNHVLDHWNNRMPATLLPRVELAHFPTRSMDQLVAKSLSSHARWASRPDHHEHVILRPFAATDFLKEERALAVSRPEAFGAIYTAQKGAETEFKPFVERRGENRYPELAAIYPYRRILSAMDGLMEGTRELSRANRTLTAQLKAARTGRVRAFLEKAGRSFKKRWKKRSIANAGGGPAQPR